MTWHQPCGPPWWLLPPMIVYKSISLVDLWLIQRLCGWRGGEMNIHEDRMSGTTPSTSTMGLLPSINTSIFHNFWECTNPQHTYHCHPSPWNYLQLITIYSTLSSWRAFVHLESPKLVEGSGPHLETRTVVHQCPTFQISPLLPCPCRLLQDHHLLQPHLMWCSFGRCGC